jgi:hypothetical protein
MITVEEGLSGKITLKRGPGGHIVCDDADKGAATAARESKPTKDSAKEGAAAKPAKEGAAAKPAKEGAATKPAKEGAATKPAKDAAPRVAAKRSAKTRRPTSLIWKATTDHGFSGWVAKTDGGQFKLLKAKGSQWALFRERPDVKPEPLGCFLKEDLGKAAAQRLHDTPAKPRPVTEVTVVEACPMPAEVEPAAAEEPAPAERREAPEPVEQPANAALDAELMDSLKRTLAELEDE